MDCIDLLLKGQTYRQIAGRLHLSSRTVESYIENLKVKTGASTKSELVELLMELVRLELL